MYFIFAEGADDILTENVNGAERYRRDVSVVLNWNGRIRRHQTDSSLHTKSNTPGSGSQT